MSVRKSHRPRNPLVHRERRLGASASSWQRGFACEDMRPLIICRGPIRKEAMDVFEEMGIRQYAILLSEKDSFAYANALAPELRVLTDPSRVFRVSDYSGTTSEERSERIRQIVHICAANGYDSVFAGYGFMAEDEELVRALEDANIRFIGPGSTTQRRAGRKDEAKRTAIAANVMVIPGVDNVAALTILGKAPDAAALASLCHAHGLEVDRKALADGRTGIADRAERVLDAALSAGVDLFTIDELCSEVSRQVAVLNDRYPGQSIRLKGVLGGGGKGQRIVAPPKKKEPGARREARIAAMVREILAELKCNGPGDNKNLLIELNVPSTRHHEIQVIGNGDWCVTLGGRDCSVQMHEQKLVEVALTTEALAEEATRLETAGRKAAAASVCRDRHLLEEMELEATRFGRAVGLDSVSTFECIVAGDRHYFMEMNTRVQVEHRVTELCYVLRFTNPEDTNDCFEVTSLVEAMVLLARHGEKLPCPSRERREAVAMEVRLNATNQALRPAAGGMIESWSNPLPHEIRDDQGISLHNPDTDRFMRYHVAGAYDSNIALLLTTGATRANCYARMAEILRRMELRGRDLESNLEFHYGLINWLIGHGVEGQPDTRFVGPWLTAIGRLREVAARIDLDRAYDRIAEYHLASGSAEDTDAMRGVIERKRDLLLRPLRKLFERPHLMAGWFGAIHPATKDPGESGSPFAELSRLYHYLNMDFVPGRPAANMIWEYDREILERGNAFYTSLATRLGVVDYAALDRALDGKKPAKMSKETWNAARGAHLGFRAGTEILRVVDFIARESGFDGLEVRDDLSVVIPEPFHSPDLQARMLRVLVPPVQRTSDTIVAESGGMFYAREAPGRPPFIEEGSHFETGDALYIIEVMKMFNRVYAPFSGRVDRVLVDTDGVVIKKGQPIFAVTPDDAAEASAEDSSVERIDLTQTFVEALESEGR